MHDYKIKILFIFFFLSLTSSCGRPPILNKIKQKIKIIDGLIYQEKFEKNPQEFIFTWIKAPSLVELSSFEITLKSKLPEGQNLHAYLWMPDMGHGSSPITIETEDNLHFNFTELSFIMPGTWVLYVEIQEAGKRIDEWKKSILL